MIAHTVWVVCPNAGSKAHFAEPLHARFGRTGDRVRFAILGGMRCSVTSRGAKISYRTAGVGAPLVLLCGWSMNADRWWATGYVDELSNDYRVIAIDRLGHGESDKPHDAALYEERLIVADLVAVLDAEGIDRATMWGYSLGAKNAASLAVCFPERVAALVCGGGGPLPGTEAGRERHLAASNIVNTVDGARAFMKSLGMTDVIVEESLQRNDVLALAATLKGTADWWPAADEIVAPSLWYKGTNDQGGLSAEDRIVAERCGVETHDLADANHAAAFAGSRDVLSFVRPFLELHRPG
jgi:pimeloyl-ACP methyl ester carboxylesterase